MQSTVSTVLLISTSKFLVPLILSKCLPPANAACSVAVSSGRSVGEYPDSCLTKLHLDAGVREMHLRHRHQNKFCFPARLPSLLCVEDPPHARVVSGRLAYLAEEV